MKSSSFQPGAVTRARGTCFVLLAVLGASLSLTSLAVCGAAINDSATEAKLARQILDATGLHGGLIVHVGCGDGKLTAALHAGENYLIQGLDLSADKVQLAREHVQQLGVYGPVSIERFDGQRLPYADNLVNLVVAETFDGALRTEEMRVLAPGGVLYAKQAEGWQKSVKARPADIDEWTHFLHDASGNPVAHDQEVGPPARLQWTADPPFMRSHEHIPGIYAVVSAGGRIFYILDQAPTASILATPKWSLVARDAFNGVLLWQQPLKDWYPHIVNWGQTPTQLERKLVAVGDRVYVTLGLHDPVSALDAATGEVRKVFENTAGTEEILCQKGVLLLAIRSVTEAKAAELAQFRKLLVTEKSPLFDRETADPLVRKFRASENKGESSILALEADSGRLLWKKEGAEVAGLKGTSLCASGERVFYQHEGELACLDLKTGRNLWASAGASLRLISGDSVYCADDKMIAALAVDTGKPRWTRDSSLTEIRDVFVADGSVWEGGFKPMPGKRSPAWGPYFVTQRDPASGSVLRQLEPENPGHHHRCYQNKATDRFILGGRRGTEFIDLNSGDVLWNSWARGVCKYGVMPANGLLYVPPHACACYMAAKLIGFNVMAPAPPKASPKSEIPSPKSESERLERGPAYSELPTLNSALAKASWPTFRGDAQRSGHTGSSVSAALHRRWDVKVGDKLTVPTVSEGKVLIASRDEHAVLALESDSGKPAWRFTAGARVDSPPTLNQGQALFGCRDGYVYNVRLSDGALAWRSQVAREDRRIVANGRIESVSPVPGSVLVENGVAYVTAGRSSYLDGGIDLCRLEARTGKALSRTPIYSPDPETGKGPPQSAPYEVPGVRADILSSDDARVYLRDSVFDHQGAAQTAGKEHLFSLTGFLDDAWAHRSYWILGTHCSVSGGCMKMEKGLTFGRLLVFNPEMIYGYGRETVHWSNQLLDGPYRLFAMPRGEGGSKWAKPLPIQAQAMLLAGKVLFVAGASEHPAAQDTSRGALLMAISATDGSILAQTKLDCPPVFDGLAAAEGRLYLALENGHVICLD